MGRFFLRERDVEGSLVGRGANVMLRERLMVSAVVYAEEMEEKELEWVRMLGDGGDE